MVNCWAVVMTSSGRGGISALDLVGAGAEEVLRRFFVPRRAGHRPLRLGVVPAGVGDRPGDALDEVLVTELPRGAHPCGEPVLRMTGHGGPAVLGALLRRAVGSGACEVSWEALLRRAVRERRLEAPAAEAHVLMPAARTLEATVLLAAAAGGGLVAGLREAVLAADAPGLEEGLAAAREGRSRVEGIRICVAGPANSGKSTLVNHLVGGPRVRVDEEPGTTLDPVAVGWAAAGYPVTLVDTAALDPPPSADPALSRLRQAAEVRARAEAARADLILYCPRPGEVLCLGPKGPGPGDLNRRPVGAPISVGAHEGDIAARLRAAIPEALGLPAKWVPGRAVPFTRRQERILREAAATSRREALPPSEVMARMRRLWGEFLWTWTGEEDPHPEGR